MNKQNIVETIIREQETIVTHLQKMRPGRFTIHDVSGTTDLNTHNKIVIALDMPLFYKESIHCSHNTLYYYPTIENNPSHSIVMSNHYRIKFEHFSDPETQDQWEQLPEKIRSQHYPETNLFFERPHRAEKMIRLPSVLETSRPEVSPQTRMFESPVTEQDIIYSERLVTLIRRRLDDYYSLYPEGHSTTNHHRV